MKDKKYFDKVIRVIIKSREKLADDLRKMLFTILKSDANFLFVKPPINVSPVRLFEHLKHKGIYIRYFKDDFCKSYLRITIGDPKENKILLNEIQAYLLKK